MIKHIKRKRFFHFSKWEKMKIPNLKEDKYVPLNKRKKRREKKNKYSIIKASKMEYENYLFELKECDKYKKILDKQFVYKYIQSILFYYTYLCRDLIGLISEYIGLEFDFEPYPIKEIIIYLYKF